MRVGSAPNEWPVEGPCQVGHLARKSVRRLVEGWPRASPFELARLEKAHLDGLERDLGTQAKELLRGYSKPQAGHEVRRYQLRKCPALLASSRNP